MSLGAHGFGTRYRAAFEAYLHEGGEGGLSAAYELGRDAVREAVSLLDLAALQHDALADAVHAADERVGAARDVRAAGEFFLESLSAFEVAQRVLQETREAALVEKRHATMLRRLSTFLTDASLALDMTGSVEEMLQLVAENARELVGARWASARLDIEGVGTDAVEALSSSDPGEDTGRRADAAALAGRFSAICPEGGTLRQTGTELTGQSTPSGETNVPVREGRVDGWLAASLTRLDGREMGLIQLFDKESGDFSDLDEAVVRQLAQMTSAAVERAQPYRRER